jgi:hypothetical protein
MPRKKKRSLPGLGGLALSHPEKLTLKQIRELGGHEIAHQAKRRKKRPSSAGVSAPSRKKAQRKSYRRK